MESFCLSLLAGSFFFLGGGRVSFKNSLVTNSLLIPTSALHVFAHSM